MTDYNHASSQTSFIAQGFAANNEHRAVVKLYYNLLFIAILTSGIVIFEPAPFDLIILLTVFLVLVSGVPFPRQIKWVFAISFTHVIGSFLGVLMSGNAGDSYMHIIITLYMVLFAIGIMIMIYNNPEKTLNIIINAYVWAALVSTILAIMGYFHIGPTYELFTLYGRAKGGFKDPNVFGPFIIPPMLYIIERIVTVNVGKKFIEVLKFGILFLGLLLCFSRGAWGLFLFSSLILLVSMYWTARSNRYRVELTLYILIAFILMCLALVAAINLPAIANLLSERASLSQSYDIEEGGRFTHHVDAIKIIIEQPWGIGAKEFGLTHSEDVHNTYLTVFLIGGWIAGFTFILIVFATIIVGFKYCFRKYALRKHFVIYYATFFGLLIEAWIIDIDHWRLLYILIGCIWGIIYHEKYSTQKAQQIF